MKLIKEKKIYTGDGIIEKKELCSKKKKTS